MTNISGPRIVLCKQGLEVIYYIILITKLPCILLKFQNNYLMCRSLNIGLFDITFIFNEMIYSVILFETGNE